MTKLLALCLVISALFTVGHCTEPEGDVIVKDGHRVVVVEYDGDGKTNTRVLISPPGKEEKKVKDEEVFRNAKRESASSLPVEEEGEHHASPGELICDTIGKCKHKMASVLGKVKDPTLAGDDLSDDTSKEAVTRDVEEKVSEKAHQAKETMKERATKKAHNAKNVWEKAKSTARGLGTAVPAALRLTKIGSVVGLIGIAAAYGMCVWVTFLSSYVLASVLGKAAIWCGAEQVVFGLLQGNLCSDSGWVVRTRHQPAPEGSY
ncbi:hypothetical protein V5N11_021042 [Cardamine amara subsp. amara]|uniref:Uncharacterized protein n=1 Tax=Cardamine amara subsp. amara TaxID=228776 RepID=A0ABD1C8P0_CARAN